MKHTVNIAVGLNVVVFDNQGHQVDEFIFPFALLFFSLSGLLYAWLKNFFLSASAFVLAWGPAGWRKDLVLIVWAARLLVHQRRFAYA